AATYLFYVRKPPLYGLVSYTLPNNHVFHTLLVSVSTFLFGDHPWAIRLPAFLAGVAMIPLAFAAARRIHGDAAGLITAAFVALAAVAYLPAILWTGPHAVFANRFVVSRPWSVWLTLIWPSIHQTWLGWNRDLGVAGMVLFGVFFAAGLARDKTRLAIIAVAWCALLVVVERWIVFPRVWTFLIPVYWMTVSVGIVFAFRRRWVVPVALAACVAIGGSVVASGSVLASRDGYFP